mmetsp:Transcript_30400/g.98618  ORF Transcript_30400/g.98618 Transcript_30400/m.98618 type:complete len:347 (+) Transcript_30400:171-1211(+)
MSPPSKSARRTISRPLWPGEPVSLQPRAWRLTCWWRDRCCLVRGRGSSALATASAMVRFRSMHSRPITSAGLPSRIVSWQSPPPSPKRSEAASMPTSRAVAMAERSRASSKSVLCANSARSDLGCTSHGTEYSWPERLSCAALSAFFRSAARVAAVISSSGGSCSSDQLPLRAPDLVTPRKWYILYPAAAKASRECANSRKSTSLRARSATPGEYSVSTAFGGASRSSRLMPATTFGSYPSTSSFSAHGCSCTTSSTTSVVEWTVYVLDLTAGSTFSPPTDAVPQMPRSGTRISTGCAATSDTTDSRTSTRWERLLRATPIRRKARKTGTGSHAMTRQPSEAAYSE